ncbi:hypothetical protein PROFUN_14592 [Planoprotostelium fungivorum]|uniref:Protein kinase domain-containing protein n=1 Tax=Planoprotostelium fungivorum TaxID=1890364 RepID=A0A2P6MZE7_9EUKA|nr:hypothetical protein PROFUN_14592 [Planoprotostelium fungivorum]
MYATLTKKPAESWFGKIMAPDASSVAIYPHSLSVMRRFVFTETIRDNNQSCDAGDLKAFGWTREENKRALLFRNDYLNQVGRPLIARAMTTVLSLGYSNTRLTGGHSLKYPFLELSHRTEFIVLTDTHKQVQEAVKEVPKHLGSVNRNCEKQLHRALEALILTNSVHSIDVASLSFVAPLLLQREWGNTKAVQTSTKSAVKTSLLPPSPAKTIVQNIEAVPAGRSSPETIPATQETVPAETHRSSSPTRAARYVPSIQRMEDDINWKNLIDVDIQLKFDPAKKLRQFVQIDVPESERQRPSSKFRIPIEDWIRGGRACSVGPVGKRIFYHPTLLLGSGGSARVYIGLREDDWTEVAFKAIDGFREDDTEKEAFYNMEIVALKERNTLNHVKMMEYTLEHVLTMWKSGSILWSLRALQENMDDVICVHRDIKPANIQFDRQKRIRLIDFGSATHLKNLSSKTTVNNTSTLFYAAPELLTDEKKVTHPKSDLFSFRIVLYELATSELTTSPKGEASPQKWWPNSPYYSKALQHMVKWVVCKNPDEKSTGFLIALGDLIRMWKDLKKTSTDEDEINSIDDVIHLIRHKKKAAQIMENLCSLATECVTPILHCYGFYKNTAQNRARRRENMSADAQPQGGSPLPTKTEVIKSLHKRSKKPDIESEHPYFLVFTPTKCIAQLGPGDCQVVELNHKRDTDEYQHRVEQSDDPTGLRYRHYIEVYVLYIYCGVTKSTHFKSNCAYIYSPTALNFKPDTSDRVHLKGPQMHEANQAANHTTQLLYIITFIYWFTSWTDKVLPRKQSFTRIDVDMMKRRVHDKLDPVSPAILKLFYAAWRRAKINGILPLPLDFFAWDSQRQSAFAVEHKRENIVIVGMYKYPEDANYSLFKLTDSTLKIFTEKEHDQTPFAENLQKILCVFHEITTVTLKCLNSQGTEIYPSAPTMRLTIVYNLLLLNHRLPPGNYDPEDIIRVMFERKTMATADQVIDAEAVNNMISALQRTYLQWQERWEVEKCITQLKPIHGSIPATPSLSRSYRILPLRTECYCQLPRVEATAHQTGIEPPHIEKILLRWSWTEINDDLVPVLIDREQT